MLNRKRILNKKAQEELAGFAIILVLLGVILLAFLAAGIKQKEEVVKNYEVDNFLQSVLQQTTICELNGKYLNIKDLIFKCEQGVKCDNGDSCTFLETTLRRMVDNSWNMNEGSQYKGYEFAILVNVVFGEDGGIAGNPLIDIEYGDENDILQSKGSFQDFSKSGNSVRIHFDIFYE